jgi:hypothetical protein
MSSQNRPSLRKWGLRILLALIAPVVALSVLEGALRLCNYGYPSGFIFRDASRFGGRVLTNPHISLTYFEPRLLREPEHVALPPEIPANSCRIVLLGASAVLLRTHRVIHYGFNALFPHRS